MEHDPIIAAAERDLAAIEMRRSEIISFLEQYRCYSQAGATSDEAANVPAAKLAPRSAPVDIVMSAVCDILIARDDAMPLSDVFDALTKRGIIIGGTNPKQNLSQKLHADNRLKSYGSRIGWYFADVVPPCLGGPSRRTTSSAQIHECEEGLATEIARPLQANGAAVSAA
jgi:hypothetical protein